MTPATLEQLAASPMLDLDEIRKERATRSLREYVAQAWHVVEPSTPFVPNWHVDAMCDHLQAVVEGQLTKLLITIPPGTAKSLMTSVMLPSWSWIDPWARLASKKPPRPLRGPHLRFLTASYNADFSTRDSVRSRMLMDSPWYRERWGGQWKFTSDQNVKTRYVNNKTGYRVSTSVGAGTGERADVTIIDDPHNIDDAESDAMRESAITWYDTTLSSRLDPQTGREVVIQQRIHERDLAGHLMAQGGWCHLNLPMEYEPQVYVTGLGVRIDPMQPTTLGFVDPRREPGEILHPARYSPARLAELRLRGSYRYNSLFQQRPAPPEGGRVKRIWFRYWHEPGTNPGDVPVRTKDGIAMVPSVPLPDGPWDEQIMSFDMTFKDASQTAAKRKKDVDFVAGGYWRRRGANKYLIDVRHGRMDFPDTLAMVRAFCAMYPEAGAKLVEDAANGPAVVATLRNEIHGIIPLPVMGGKGARLAAASPQIESGNVYLKHPAQSPHTENVIAEMITFPNGVNDDLLDMVTQALIRMAPGSALQMYGYGADGRPIVPPAPPKPATEVFVQGGDPTTPEGEIPCVRCGRSEADHPAGWWCAGYTLHPKDLMSREQRIELGLEEP